MTKIADDLAVDGANAHGVEPQPRSAAILAASSESTPVVRYPSVSKMIAAEPQEPAATGINALTGGHWSRVTTHYPQNCCFIPQMGDCGQMMEKVHFGIGRGRT